jgi:hypothetical protein
MWNTWFAWRPVRLFSGRWVWWRQVEWKSMKRLRPHPSGVYTVERPAYRIPFHGPL